MHGCMDAWMHGCMDKFDGGFIRNGLIAFWDVLEISVDVGYDPASSSPPGLDTGTASSCFC